MAFGKKKPTPPTPAELYESAVDAYEMAKLDYGVSSVAGVMLKTGEIAYMVVEEIGFIEPKRLPSTWQGGSRGVSLRIAKGVNYRVGASRGHMQQGAEVIQATDSGTFVATNRRFIFIGSKRTTEWALSKLVGFSLDGEPGTALFNVTNRQKPSGVAYGVKDEQKIEAIIAAVIAREQGSAAHRDLLDELGVMVRQAATAAQLPAPDELRPAELTSGSWAPPTLTAPVAPAASWLPDPHGRFHYRWWDGRQWSSSVSRDGEVSEDPTG